jgi:hypothetical protein
MHVNLSLSMGDDKVVDFGSQGINQQFSFFFIEDTPFSTRCLI